MRAVNGQFVSQSYKRNKRPAAAGRISCHMSEIYAVRLYTSYAAFAANHLSQNEREITMKSHLAYLLWIFIFFLGCSSIELVDTSAVTYKARELDFSTFKNSTITVLPVLAGEGYEGFRRLTGDCMTDAFKDAFPGATIYSHSEALDKINAAGMSSSYSSTIENYSKSAILDKQILNDLGSRLKTDFLVYSKVGRTGTTRVGIVHVEGLTPVVIATSVNEIEIFAQIWDTRKGDVVWERTGGAAGLKRAKGTDLNSLVRQASIGLAKRVGKSAEEVPVPQSAEDIHESQQSSITVLYLSITTGLLLVTALILLQ